MDAVIEQIKGRLLKKLSDIEKINVKQATEKNDLGGLNFAQFSLHLQKTQKLFLDLKNLPLENLTEGVLSLLDAKAHAYLTKMTDLLLFSPANLPEGKSLRDERDRFVSIIRGDLVPIHEEIAPWVSFLKTESFEGATSLEDLAELVANARNLSEQMKKLEEEAKSTLIAIQDSAGQIGVSKYAELFDNASKEYKKASRTWLLATGGGITITAVIGLVLIFCWPLGDNTGLPAIQKLVGKAFLLSILLTGTLWMARNYRAFKHLQVSNEHRKYALSTFETFIKAAGDDHETKNAVLLETTRSIFATTGSGFVPHDDSNLSSSKIFETIRTFKSSN